MSRRLIGLTALAVAAVFALGAEEDGCSEFEEEKPTVQKQGGGKGEVAKVGDKLTLKGTTYQVTSATTAQTVGDQYVGETASGVFVLIDLNLTNRKKEPATITEANISLIGGNGSTYSQDTEASFSLENPLVLLTEIQPGVTQEGQLIYDIPKKALKGAKLRVEDFFSTSSGEIRLGL